MEAAGSSETLKCINQTQLGPRENEVLSHTFELIRNISEHFYAAFIER